MKPKYHVGYGFHLSYKMTLGWEEGSRNSGRDRLRASSVCKKVSRRLTDPAHVVRGFLLSHGQSLSVSPKNLLPESVFHD